MLPTVNEALDFIGCLECQETSELPRKPKLSLPPQDTLNIVVSLDAIPHKIRNKKTDIWVIIDHGDMLFGLKTLSNRIALTAFNAFYSRWISAFDAHICVYLYRGSNISAELMKKKIHEVDSQLCPVPTKAPWSIGLNENLTDIFTKAVTSPFTERL